MNYPVLYIVCQNGRQLNSQAFMVMLWKSIYQALVIFIFSISAFNSIFLDIVTVSYSTLVFVELLNIFLMVPRPNYAIWITILASFLFYLVSVFALRSYLGLMYIDGSMWVKIFIITLICWGPFRVFNWFRKRCFPSVSDKIMKIAVGERTVGMNNEDVFDGDLETREDNMFNFINRDNDAGTNELNNL